MFLKVLIEKYSLNGNKQEKIKEVFNLKPKSAERVKKMKHLTNYGDFEHNLKVLKDGHGRLLPRNPSVPRSHDEFAPCTVCKAFVAKVEMSRHARTTCQPWNEGPEGPEVTLNIPSEMLQNATINLTGSTRGEQIVQRMNKDDVKTAIAGDELLMAWANYLKMPRGRKKDKHVSQRLRIMGRALVFLRDKYPEKSLMEFLSPTYYADFEDFARFIGEFYIHRKDSQPR